MSRRTLVGLALALPPGLLLCGLLALAARCGDEAHARAQPPPRVPLERAFAQLSEQEARAEVRVLDDAPRSFAERWRMLDEAERSLDVAYFILHDDCFGLAFVGRLYQRALAGVDVRLLVDARGSKPLVSAFGGRGLLRTLIGTGHADVRVYNPPLATLERALQELAPLLPVARSHLKVMVADEEEGIVGGRNIAADYFASPAELPTVAYDVDVWVASERTGRALARAFETDFEAPYNERIEDRAVTLPFAQGQQARGEELLLYANAMDLWLKGALGPLPGLTDPAAELERRAAATLPLAPSYASLVAARPVLEQIVRYPSHYGLLPEGRSGHDAAGMTSARVRVLYGPSLAADEDRAVWRGVLSVLRAAEHEVYIESPYLVLTEDGLAVLEELSRRGVVVHIYTNGPRSSDNDLSQALFIAAWPEILARAPTLRLYVSDGDQLMHAKRVVVDGKLTLIGTYNLDLLSAHVNSEVILAAWDEGFARENGRLMKERRARPYVRRYRIALDDDGRALRYPEGDAREGEVIVRDGPAQHTPPERIKDLLRLRQVVTTFDHFADLEPAVW